MTNTISSTYGINTSWASGGQVYGHPAPTTYETYDLASMVHEINSLKNYIDHLEKIMTDFEGRLEILEENNG